MRCNQPTALSLLITILAFPVVSQAAPVTVTATGVVYNVNDPDNRLPFTPLIVGSTRVAITFTYESNAFGFDLNSTTKLYPLAITAMSLTIGDTTLTPTVNEGPIAILDDTDISENRPDLPYMDQWNSSADAVGVDETERFKFILLTLSSTTPVGPLTSTDLVEPVWPSAWNQGHIRYQIVDTNNYEIVLASVSAAIIPIPPALWLLGSALGLLGWMRRKTSGVFGQRGISLSFCAERWRSMRVLLFVPLIFATVFAAGSLHAATVNVTATGNFSDYSDPSGLLPFSMPAAGTEFTLTISYDDQTSDALPGNPKVGLYLNTVSSSTLVISSEPFTATGTGNIVIIDDALTDDGTNYGDIWQTFSSVSSAGITEDSIGLLLINPQPELPVTPLTSDALIEPFGPTGWLVANISYRVVESPALGDSFVAAFANAHIDTITVSPVPVPPAFLLFGSALSAMGWLRGRVG